MKAFFLALAISPLLLVVASSAQAANYVQTHVRIETADSTIYAEDVYISDAGCTVKDSAGKKHVVTGAKAVCALKAAASVGGFEYVLQDSSYGLYLTAIADHAATTADYWSFFVNYTAASVGVADQDVVNGDEIILSLGGYPNSALQVRVSSKEVVAGRPVIVRVKADGEPVAGAIVYVNDLTFTTNATGKVRFKPSRGTTNLSVYATATGATRSATTTVRVVPKFKAQAVSTTQQQAMMLRGVDYLTSETSTTQSVLDWTAISLAVAGVDTSSVSAAVLAYDPTTDMDYATGEIARHILAVEALGLDAHTVNGVDYVARLLSLQSDGQFGDAAYVNDDIFAGLALLASGASTDNADVQVALQAAQASVNSDGGVSYAVAETTSDVDTTAYFVYFLSVIGVENEVMTDAVQYLVEQQNLDGGWGYAEHGTSNSASTGVALQALESSGQNLATIRRNHRTGYNFLKATQKPNGRFVYDTTGSTSNEVMNTNFAVLALSHLPLIVL